jgi:hypothetical protein
MEMDFFGLSDIGTEEKSFKTSMLLPRTLKTRQFPYLK